MMRPALAILIPSAVIVLGWMMVPTWPLSEVVIDGIRLGLVVGWVQSLISVVAQRWAWNKKCFYWVWGSGLLLRAAVLGFTAFYVHRQRYPDLLSTLLSLIGATTMFLVAESSIFYRKN